MKEFDLKGVKVLATDCVEGVFIDPHLDADFDDTDNRHRPPEQMIWWDVPYVVTYRETDPGFLKTFPSGVRYDVRCLDGGAWDRSTWWGSFDSLPECINCAKSGPKWRFRGLGSDLRGPNG